MSYGSRHEGTVTGTGRIRKRALTLFCMLLSWSSLSTSSPSIIDDDLGDDTLQLAGKSAELQVLDYDYDFCHHHHHQQQQQDGFENSTQRRILLHHLRGTDSHQHTTAADVVDTTMQYRQQKMLSSLVPPAGNVSVPLHAHSGTHHVHVYIGSPPQRQTLIVDTGSRLMAFGCKPCRSCGIHASPYFDPNLSTTKRIPTCGHCQLSGISTCSLYNDQCVMSQKYTEGSSWHGQEINDIVWLGTPNVEESIEFYMGELAVPYAFGCQTSAKGLFRKQYADGILGLARHDETSIVFALYHAQAIPRNAFSLCLTRTGGHLTLGGPLQSPSSSSSRGHPPYPLEPMRLTPITREHGWYSIQLVQLQVGDITIAMDYDYQHHHDTTSTSSTSTTTKTKMEESSLRRAISVLNDGKGVILDSGTTDTYLPSLIENIFSNAVSTFTNGTMTGLISKQRTRLYTYEEFQQLPEITFVFTNDVTIVMTPQNYMEGFAGSPPQLDERHLHPAVLARQGGGSEQLDHLLWPSSNTVPSSTSQEEQQQEEYKPKPWKGTKTLTCRIYCTEAEGAVLGANAMFGYDILFDVQGHQVGIAKANCEDRTYGLGGVT